MNQDEIQYIRHYILRNWKRKTLTMMAEGLGVPVGKVNTQIKHIQKLHPHVEPITLRDLLNKKILTLVNKFPAWYLEDIAGELKMKPKEVETYMQAIGLEPPARTPHVQDQIAELVHKRNNPREVRRPSKTLNQSPTPFGIADALRDRNIN